MFRRETSASQLNILRLKTYQFVCLTYGFAKRIFAVMQEKQHKVYLDVLRVIAILLVIFNHTPAFCFPFQTIGESMGVKLMLIFSAFDKVAVPLFFMISGALLLPKQESLKILISKRVGRFLIILLLFHVVQASYYYWMCGEAEIGFRSFLGDCYWGNSSKGYVLGWTEAYAVWFLYAYIALLLMLPFLRAMVKGMEMMTFYYLFALQIMLCVVVPAMFVLVTGFTPEGFRVLTYLPLCGNVLVYVIAGYYVEYKVSVEKMKKWHILCLISASGVFILLAGMMPEWARSRMGAEYVNQYIPGLSSYMLVPCITFYIVVKKLLASASEKKWVVNIARALGGAVFVVMLVENILRKEISVLFSDYESAYLPSILVSCLVWISGLLLGLVCKQIPLLKKVL